MVYQKFILEFSFLNQKCTSSLEDLLVINIKDCPWTGEMGSAGPGAGHTLSATLLWWPLAGVGARIHHSSWLWAGKGSAIQGASWGGGGLKENVGSPAEGICRDFLTGQSIHATGISPAAPKIPRAPASVQCQPATPWSFSWNTCHSPLCLTLLAQYTRHIERIWDREM
jgi:hypothetical protein